MCAYLRKVTEQDMKLLFEWANEENVRANSFSTAAIEYEEHKKWFKKLLQDESSQQYIYIFDEEETGQIRITISGGKAEVSYSIRADKRNKGHGKKILKLLEEEMQKNFPDVKKIIARVKPENVASQKAFLASGYMEVSRSFELVPGKYETAPDNEKEGKQ